MIIGSERVEWDRLTSGPLPKNPPTQNGNIVSYLSIANLIKINTASFGAIHTRTTFLIITKGLQPILELRSGYHFC